MIEFVLVHHANFCRSLEGVYYITLLAKDLIKDDGDEITYQAKVIHDDILSGDIDVQIFRPKTNPGKKKYKIKKNIDDVEEEEEEEEEKTEEKCWAVELDDGWDVYHVVGGDPDEYTWRLKYLEKEERDLLVHCYEIHCASDVITKLF
jgi:hypothetical protein